MTRYSNISNYNQGNHDVKIIVSFATIPAIIVLTLILGGKKRKRMGLLRNRIKSNKQLNASDYVPNAGSLAKGSFIQVKNRLAVLENISSRKKLVLKVLMLLLIVIAFLFVLYENVPGVRTGLEKINSSLSAVVNGPCNGDRQLIKRYNVIVKNEGVQALGNLNKEVKSKRNYSNDATCVYIATLSAYAQSSNGGLDELQNQYEQLDALSDKNKLPSKDIADGLDKKKTFALIERLINERKKNYYGQG